MKAEYINLFIEAAQEVLKALLGTVLNYARFI